MPHVIGIDPGQHGGAALLDHRRRLVTAMTWRPSSRNRQRGYRLSVVGEDGESEWLPDAAALATEIVNASIRSGVHHADVYVETAFVGRNARTALSLSRWSGMMVGGLLGSARPFVGAVCWVEPDRWRRVAFDAAVATRRQEAKETVRAAIRQRYPTVGFLASPTLSEHLADAIGVACFGCIDRHDQQEPSKE